MHETSAPDTLSQNAVLDFESGPSYLEPLIATGEVLAPDEFAARLGWTPKQLSEALAAERIFFIERGNEHYYPTFFADVRYSRRQLATLSRMLANVDGSAKLMFFRQPRGSLNRASPLQALARGDFPEVKAAAEAFAEG